MKSVNLPVLLAFTFLWIGFVCAISFMESWIKFRAPGITLPLGLGIGRLVFAALNRVEWIILLAMAVTIFVSKMQVYQVRFTALLLAGLLLIVQTIWLLPELDARAELHINNIPVPPSGLHFWFAGLEVIKVAALFIFGVLLIKSNN